MACNESMFLVLKEAKVVMTMNNSMRRKKNAGHNPYLEGHDLLFGWFSDPRLLYQGPEVLYSEYSLPC